LSQICSNFLRIIFKHQKQSRARFSLDSDLFEWLLLIGRWTHITVAVTWIGTSVFFMWLDRSFSFNERSNREGYVGELWMVHGGGFYRVEKLLMGPTKAPEVLHWFKWESYWTWMSGMFLLGLIFYTNDGLFLLDDTVSELTYFQGVLLGVFSIFGSWFFYDSLWEWKLAEKKPLLGHLLTVSWFIGITYLLCHSFSGRAAYMHVGAMLGTWMAGNVFRRIIPRQLKMVEASKRGEPVNEKWGKNAKNRSTHNTYFTLPIILIMMSNHFPSTYGHHLNWLILVLLSIVGASVREAFIVRLSSPKRAVKSLVAAVVTFLVVVFILKNGV